MDKTKTSISFELLKKVSIYHDEEIIIIDRIKKIYPLNLPAICTALSERTQFITGQQQCL